MITNKKKVNYPIIISTANQNKNINNRWVATVKKLLPVINILHLKSRDENVENFVRLVEHLTFHKGSVRALELLKQFRLSLQQYVLKQTVTNIPFCKTDRDGIPKVLTFVKPNRDSKIQVMYTLSILRIIDEFTLPPAYSVESITSVSNAKSETLRKITDYIRGNPRILKVLPKELPEPRFILSNKAGPNGPCSITSLRDLAALRRPENENLYNTIKDFIEDNLPHVSMSKYEASNEDTNYKVSKLVLLSDKAGKTRPIAIADWWSNVCLSGIHDAFMKGLRRLPRDVTYFQDKVPSLVSDMGPSLYSSDMSAFTDRFPIHLEIEVVKAAYGAQIGKIWETILTDREFYHKEGSVRYRTGNPMGLLSSWAVSTFTHHVVKSWCCEELGLKYKNYKYLILGDDTLDSRLDVYNLYKQTIEDLGVSISITKCTQSEDGYAEFAKRLYSPGGEITGLPVHLLAGLYSNPEQALELVRICRSRGYEDSILGPALEILLTEGFISKPKIVADILSLPEHVTGVPPLFEVKPGSHVDQLCTYGETYIQAALLICREHLFWKLTENIQVSQGPKHISPIEIDNNHPLIFALNESIDRFLPEDAFCDDTWEEDELYIYNKWMEGEYQHLVNIPSINTYKYYNRGHKITKCNFDVYRLLLELAVGNMNIPLTARAARTNQDLYDIALASITPKRDHQLAVTTSFTK